MRRIVVLTAVILTLMIVPTSIYALQNPRNSGAVKTPEEIALDFIKGSPTFKFDGITSTLVVEDVYMNKSYPPQYVVTLSFQCLHSGYGNRAGKIVLQAITPHTAVVTIKDGVVLSAVIDGVWDEVGQMVVKDQVKEYVETIALNWLIKAPTFKFDGIIGSATIVDSWLAMTFAAPSFWGVTIEFDCLHAGYGDRTGQMLAEVITHHVITIHVIEGAVTLAQIDDKWDELKQLPTGQSLMPEVDVALNWLYNCPTFKFDGIKDSIKILDGKALERYPVLYVYEIGFTCSSAGYGDRSGEVVAQVLTKHIIVIQIESGKVISAVIDGVWDEINQESLANIYSAEKAEQTALDWLMNCPTFMFDGIPETVKVKSVEPLRMLYTWEVTIDFTCNYPGYGDRTGNIMYGPSQNHTIKITVSKGMVGRAIIDEAWDEINQNIVGEDSQVLSPEDARDIVVRYLIEKLGHNYEVPEVWMIEDIEPQLLGLEKTRYTGGKWIVTIEYAVIHKPVYTIAVEVDSASWRGKVDQSGSVLPYEVNPEMPQLIYTPDIARKMCIDYLIVNHPEVVKEIPVEWTEENLVPEGIVGLTNVEYTSGSWTVIVSAPVVWKPTHTVSISYSGDVAFKWEGILPQGGPVEETSFSK